jgi:23S rRNA G2445 N2-methylase RlmL
MDRRDRRNDTCEVFTPQETVREMLSSLPAEMFLPDKTFLDNSCGNGNMLVEVLMMKLERAPEVQQSRETPLKIKIPYIKACIESLYGTDMMEDNVEECKKRILDVYNTYAEGNSELEAASVFKELEGVLDKHIVCTKMEDWDYEKWCPIHEKLF